MDSIKVQLEKVGIQVIGGQDHGEFPPPESIDGDKFEAYQIDKDVGAVVVGLDFNYTVSKLSLASLYL